LSWTSPSIHEGSWKHMNSIPVMATNIIYVHVLQFVNMKFEHVFFDLFYFNLFIEQYTHQTWICCTIAWSKFVPNFTWCNCLLQRLSHQSMNVVLQILTMEVLRSVNYHWMQNLSLMTFLQARCHICLPNIHSKMCWLFQNHLAYWMCCLFLSTIHNFNRCT
jgi:hypothetical protein